MSRRWKVLLAGLAAGIWVFVLLVSDTGKTVATDYYDMQLAAYEQMAQAMVAVKGYKAELLIELSPLDTRGTGMIGQEYNGITTTLGAIEAKRTTADPNMAAMVVRMLWDAGLREKDKVGAGFSGSFPSLNLAVICACEAMGIELTYISSVGASTYGANDEKLTFPIMAHRLYEDGYIAVDSSLVTMGGDYDIGYGMDEEMAAAVKKQLSAAGLVLLEEKDFSKNLAARKALYEKNGIDCFVAVGGNTTSLGLGESSATVGQGLLESGLSMARVDEKSGLVQWYQAQGLPVINLLNIKQIVAEYGLPFDPAQTLPAGESAVFYTNSYQKGLIATGFLLATGTLGVVFYLRRPPSAETQLPKIE